MEKLLDLISKCKGEVHILVNGHRSSYMTVREWWKEYSEYDRGVATLDKEILLEMVSRDSVVEVQFYPLTPIGSYTVYHYDLGTAIECALRILEEDVYIDEQTRDCP